MLLRERELLKYKIKLHNKYGNTDLFEPLNSIDFKKLYTFMEQKNIKWISVVDEINHICIVTKKTHNHFSTHILTHVSAGMHRTKVVPVQFVKFSTYIMPSFYVDL